MQAMVLHDSVVVVRGFGFSQSKIASHSGKVDEYVGLESLFFLGTVMAYWYTTMVSLSGKAKGADVSWQAFFGHFHSKLELDIKMKFFVILIYDDSASLPPLNLIK